MAGSSTRLNPERVPGPIALRVGDECGGLERELLARDEPTREDGPSELAQRA
jgi:hypothetical protein